jgi:hypothetical protein
MKYDLRLQGEDRPITSDTLGGALDFFIRCMPTRHMDFEGERQFTLTSYGDTADRIEVALRLGLDVVARADISVRASNESATPSLDTKVIEAIRGGSRRLSDISANTGLESRKVDTILQRLRKNGVLSWSSKPGWTLADKKPAPAAQIATVEAFDGFGHTTPPSDGEDAPESILAPERSVEVWDSCPLTMERLVGPDPE